MRNVQLKVTFSLSFAVLSKVDLVLNEVTYFRGSQRTPKSLLYSVAYPLNKILTLCVPPIGVLSYKDRDWNGLILSIF
jgi:hypothetical protein